MVLLTDAEEDGLLGAAAVVDDPEVRERLKVVINVEAMGADAPVRLFETGPGNGWLADVVGDARRRTRAARRSTSRSTGGCRTTPTSRCSSARAFRG